MAKSVRSRADEQFAATQKKAKQFVKDKDKAWQELTDRVAKQKALRLAKEAADQEAAELPNRRLRRKRLPKPKSRHAHPRLSDAGPRPLKL